ncbi:LOW QUALITY PROTEIN: acyl-CoA synthetase short chain family member 2 like [Polypterus senegalus]|uniref:LOW QUALITY PROTEIN: acyl-CoA synthetase short chain family member 2 like n=1 Tax=Polypterus senegalus TaxID=55291 RepID=UPI00196304C9|nr:LOW QUALITY PROTEIN: acyl-CoA synthetase short chain family member 2 like [Polypterus senegalus]
MGLPGAEATKQVVFNPPLDLQKDAHIPDFKSYKELYKKSVEEPEEFWKEVAQDFFWHYPPKGPLLQHNFNVAMGPVYVKFMEGAKTNICYNLLDKNIKEKNLGEKVAYYWEQNSPGQGCCITYNLLLKQVCKFANVLKSMGVKRGDKVAIYLPMIPELVYTLLACARIGAVHSVVFAGFSSESLCERILDAQCSLLVTADGVYRGEKLINLKQITDEALVKCRRKGSFAMKKCVVIRHLQGCARNGSLSNILQTPWNVDIDVWWDEVMESSSEECEPEWIDAEDPLFILYTSGSTGKPKGVLHTVAGYMLYTALTFKYVFDYHEDDVYWSTADIGWITGHSYSIYGPLANGATSILFEGIPVYPHVGRFWEIIEKYKVTKFYTAPTAIRLLMKYGTEPIKKYNLDSLKIMATVGEPINTEAWLWCYNIVGQKRCPVLDTFWQTETGGHVLTPLPAATPLKPGSATLPFFGILPAILSDCGEELEGEAEGYLVFKQPWPGMMRTVNDDHKRFENTYFTKFPGYYMTGDGCRRDKDGYYWITGRIDDMLNVSGHLLSTAEVESALTEHPAVAEAAVVSRPHSVKGECLYCFVTLKDGREFSHSLVEEIKKQVREKIGPIATPDFIQNAPALPKTRSGKIMRRVLRQIACNEKDLGDLSTLADPKVVDVLISHRREAAA